MKIVAMLLVVAIALLGCATPGYDRYAAAVAKQAEYNADIRRQQAQAIMELAKAGDATTKTMAVVMLALQQGPMNQAVLEPPRDAALQWANVIMPSVTALAGGYFGYRLGVTQSNNAAATSIAGYNTMGTIAGAGFSSVTGVANSGFTALTPQPLDLAAILGSVKPTITIGGDGVVGDGSSVSKPTTTTTTNTTTTTTTTNCTGGSAAGAGAAGSAGC